MRNYTASESTVSVPNATNWHIILQTYVYRTKRYADIRLTKTERE
jgi:hypothetical protein